MNRIWKTITLALLVLSLLCTGALAEGHTKGLFDFINAYQTPLTQPDLTAEQQQALSVRPGNSVETAYATYTVTDVAFDGRILDVLVQVTPREDVLLISGYMYEDTDPICYEDSEENSESFAQRAAREQKKLIVTGIFSGNTVDEMSWEGESYSEAFYLDGTMQFHGRIPMKEYTPVFDRTLQIREALYGDEYTVTDLPLHVEPTAHLAKSAWQGSMQSGLLTLTRVELNRSEIGASLYVYASVKEALSAQETEQLSALEILSSDVQSISGGYFVMDKQGQMMLDNPTGGETIMFANSVAAGSALPTQLTFSLHNYSLKETLGEFTVPLVPTAVE